MNDTKHLENDDNALQDRNTSGSEPISRAININGKTFAELLGEIAWLITQDKIQRKRPISDLESKVMPAIISNRIKIFYARVGDIGPAPNRSSIINRQDSTTQPVGVVIWDIVTDNSENRNGIVTHGSAEPIITNATLKKNFHLTKIIAPFGGGEQMRADVMAHLATIDAR